MAKQIGLGFHTCELSVFNNEKGDAPKTADGTEVIKVNNGDAQGAAQELKIDGLGGETKKQYGNDGVAFVGTKSLGDVKATLTALGVTLAEKAKLTGARVEGDKVFMFAPDNTVPYCSMFATAKTEDGKYLCIGLMKCKASLGDQNLNTLDDGAPEPKGEEITLEAGSDGREGSESVVIVEAVLDKDDTEKEAFQKLRDWVLRITTPDVHTDSELAKKVKARS